MNLWKNFLDTEERGEEGIAFYTVENNIKVFGDFKINKDKS